MAKRALVIGYFNTGNAYRHDFYIAYSLHKDFGFVVDQFDYRTALQYSPSDSVSYHLASMCAREKYDVILICSGRGLDFTVFDYVKKYSPKTTIINWFSDFLFEIPTPWLKEACSHCDRSFIESGHTPWLGAHLDRHGNPMIYMPHCPHPDFYYPMDIEKDLDVVFMGTPHSDRLSLLSFLLENGVDLQVFGNRSMEYPWPKEFEGHIHPAVFGNDCNLILNRAKIVLNPNMAVDEYLTISDRYFLPLATETASVCQWVSGIEEVFTNNEAVVYYKDDYPDCLNKITDLLSSVENMQNYAMRGYKLFNDKYNLPAILGSVLTYV